MPLHHFAAADYFAILLGFCAFSIVACLPGFALGFLTNALRFRERTLPFQLAASVPLSLTVGPVLAYTVGRWWSLNAVLGIFAVLSAYGVYVGARAVPKTSFRILDKKVLVVLALVAVWLVIALLLLADIQFGRRLYYSIIAFDYAVRIEFTQSISTHGIPAQNPFGYMGQASPLRYHYFWMALCSLVQRTTAGLVDARQGFMAGTMWCGIGLICLIPLYLRTFCSEGAANLYRRSLIGIGLLGVTGLDILGALFLLWLNRIGLIGGVSPSVEWWNEQVDGWLYTMLWEPHYLCALVACLTGFLVLWDAAEDTSARGRVTAGVVAGLGFASAVGAGIYVAMVFAAFLVVWTLVSAAKGWYRETATLIGAGVTALMFTIPYLRGLQSAHATGGQLLQLTVRSFSIIDLVLKVFQVSAPWKFLVADFLTIPVNYFLELGVFFVAGSVTWRDFRQRGRPATRQEIAAFAMAGTSIVVCTFVKSSVIANNDFGWRGFLIAQFVLLLWAAELLARPDGLSESTRSLMKLLVVLGVAGVLYDLSILRFFPVLSDAGKVPKLGWIGTDERVGERTYANREAYEWLRGRTSPGVIMQHNPTVSQETLWGLYGQRQTIAADSACGTGFGGDPDLCPPVFARLEELFLKGSGESFEAACSALPIDIFVVKDTDPVWRDRSSWVWNRKAIFGNEFVRLFACRSGGL